jgi:glyoxylase-like metal-dependent hydrolase (beta-lactamase superfamily II)
MEPHPPEPLAPGVTWFDDWYALHRIVPGLTAIGEPRYHQRNWSYLIDGTGQALLFDSGPGLRNIAPVVDALTAKPLTVLPSHLHYDHVGNLHRFSTIAMADLPRLKALERDGVMAEDSELFLGQWENLPWPSFRVEHWIAPGTVIDLGGRTLEVVHTPGHSPDSISLHVQPENILLVADFLYPGPLYAQVPGSSLAEYLATATALLARCTSSCRLFAAHGADPAPEGQCAPEMTRADIADLKSALERLKVQGSTPEHTLINPRMTLLADKAAFASWQAR